MDAAVVILSFYLLYQTSSAYCPQNLVRYDHQGQIDSPLFPSLYPDYIHCTWQMTVRPPASQHVQLSFSSFDLEECKDCLCDYVEVVDVVEHRNISLGRFCGNDVPGPFYSSRNTLLLVFKSDVGESGRGFRALYSHVSSGEVCRNFTTLVTTAGNVISPGFPNKYAKNMDCIWKIIAPKDTRIKFKFLAFDIQNCTEPVPCSCDYVEFRDGNSSSAEVIGRFCGSKTPRYLYSSNRYLFVKFKSDDRASKKGFSAAVSSTRITNDSCPANWRYPLKCENKMCCYDNQPSCCETGGRRCEGEGKSVRDYCPRPGDHNKQTFCCEVGGVPSCCLSRGAMIRASSVILLEIILSLILQLRDVC